MATQNRLRGNSLHGNDGPADMPKKPKIVKTAKTGGGKQTPGKRLGQNVGKTNRVGRYGIPPKRETQTPIYHSV